MDSITVNNDYALGWGTLALINAGLAETKGKSRLLWFVLSIFLGPIATLVIVVTDRAAPGAAKPTNATPA